MIALQEQALFPQKAGVVMPCAKVSSIIFQLKGACGHFTDVA